MNSCNSVLLFGLSTLLLMACGSPESTDGIRIAVTTARVAAPTPCQIDPQSAACCAYGSKHGNMNDFCCKADWTSCCTNVPVKNNMCCPNTSEQNPDGSLKKKCVEINDTLKTTAKYGDKVQKYMDFFAHSNGRCTGSGFGDYQCTLFAENFYAARLNHVFSIALQSGQASYDNALAKEFDIIKSEAADKAQNKIPNTDPLFFFTNNELPRDTDFISQTGGGYGHAVIGEHPRPDVSHPNTWSLPIIEENVAINNDNCHKRELVVTYNGSTYDIQPGLGTKYTHHGIIRHNLAGVYADEQGFHKNDNSSKPFRIAYQMYGRRLGWAFDNKSGTPFVHQVGSVLLQDFVNRQSVAPYSTKSGETFVYTPETPFGADGQTAIILDQMAGKAHVVKEGFWGTYKCLVDSAHPGIIGGATLLKAPTSDEVTEILDSECRILPTGTAVLAQHFSDGSCMWWGTGPECPVSGQACVHVHIPNLTVTPSQKPECAPVVFVNNPPGPSCPPPVCSANEVVCKDATTLNMCELQNGCYDWLSMSCAAGLQCVSGVCMEVNNPPPPPPPPQGGVLAQDGEMKLDPLSNGWQILSYYGNYNNVTSYFIPAPYGGSTGNGAERLQANGVGQLEWTAQFVTHVAVQGGQQLTVCFSAMADIPGVVSIFLQQEASPYKSYGLWQDINLTMFYPYNPICTSFAVPAGVSDQSALFGMEFGDHSGGLTVDSLTLTSP